ncbi:Gibberellin 2-beta-dioxygenase 2 [Morus notabilis]|uniref:gibberellin 2beta-dioxygenase n=1 Tax=Morus notabilis TaxID=981085 RepID=W9S8N5_9ROSA|nr:gibberellin 2-beta-dioxygenase 2 [Morus notabilis]EXB94374.1 Gibberellin 2-beta-dioxygenase 2 [Morus notabilis]
MVVPTPIYPIHNEKINDAIELPTIDLSCPERSEVSRLIVKACEEFGFFKVINHGVPNDIITKMEQESLNFFAKPMAEKQMAGPAKPFGYGCKNIGFNGDMGDVEYILLNTNPLSISHCSKIISNNPTSFSCAVSWYIEAVKGLACEILDLMGDGLLMSDRKLFSKLINHTDNDSLFRLNHYPNINTDHHDHHHHHHYHHHHSFKVGFGEHSDPQMLTLLRSNDVGGLQISLQDKVWVPVPPDPTAFLVNVGDVLQAMTNGRFVSVRHRVTNSYNDNDNNKSRMSMAYFAAPPLNAWIRAPTEVVVAQDKPCLFRPFTWAEYKRTAYSLRLNESRLNLFIVSKDCDDHIIKETIYNI